MFYPVIQDEDEDEWPDEVKDEKTWHWIVLVAKVVDHWISVQRGHMRLVTVTCLRLFPALTSSSSS